jgi:D-amino peptidase
VKAIPVKVYISVDMEGVGGVAGSYQVLQSPGSLLEVRQTMTAEVNAVIEGALAAGTEAIYVNENHSGRDLILSELHPAAEAIIGKPKPLATLEGLDESFDAVFLIGMHARAGTPAAVMDHTWGPTTVYEMRVNDITIGELGLNALMASHYGVPIVLVSGDDKTVAEAKALLGDVEGVIVKYSIDRFAARCLHPEKVQNLLYKGARQALMELSRFKPFVLESPLRMSIDWHKTNHALYTAMIPGTNRTGPRSVSFEASSFKQIMEWFVIACWVAKRVEDSVY